MRATISVSTTPIAMWPTCASAIGVEIATSVATSRAVACSALFDFDLDIETGSGGARQTGRA
jgi:hypothetical protein